MARLVGRVRLRAMNVKVRANGVRCRCRHSASAVLACPVSWLAQVPRCSSSPARRPARTVLPMSCCSPRTGRRESSPGRGGYSPTQSSLPSWLCGAGRAQPRPRRAAGAIGGSLRRGRGRLRPTRRRQGLPGWPLLPSPPRSSPSHPPCTPTRSITVLEPLAPGLLGSDAVRPGPPAAGSTGRRTHRLHAAACPGLAKAEVRARGCAAPWFAPPLVAFAAWFAGWHAVRHLCRLVVIDGRAGRLEAPAPCDDPSLPGSD